MKKQNRIPFIGVLLSGAVCYLLIHFWFADWYASAMDVSRDTAYYTLVTFLALYTAVRAYLTAKGKDELANWVDKQFKK
jgi:hypothetical protein